MTSALSVWTRAPPDLQTGPEVNNSLVAFVLSAYQGFHLPTLGLVSCGPDRFSFLLTPLSLHPSEMLGFKLRGVS